MGVCRTNLRMRNWWIYQRLRMYVRTFGTRVVQFGTHAVSTR